jgi:hypothetical protein
MRKTSPVLALSTILASLLLIAVPRPADAACANGSSSGCDGSGQSIGKLAEADGRPGPEGPKASEPDLPPDLWDRWDRIRRLPLSGPELEDINARIADIVHKIMDARTHARDAQKKIDDADSAIDKLRGDRVSAEGEKHAAEDEETRQEGRFIATLENALHEFRPPPPPRPAEEWRGKRWWVRPRPVFHHYCPPLYRPPFPPPLREHEFHEFRPNC